MNLVKELEQRQQTNQPIGVGLVGVGQMGAGMIAQIDLMQGMDVVAAADIDLQRAAAAFHNIGVPEDKVVTLPADATLAQANQALAAGGENFT